MTVIVAVTDGKRVCMACDSQASNVNGYIAPVRYPKIVRKGDVLIGNSGGLSVCDWVRWTLPDYSLAVVPDDPLAKWAAQYLGPAFRDFGASAKIAEADKGANWINGSLLVAHGAEMCVVEGDGGVLSLDVPYMAIGSGAGEARGAIWAAMYGPALNYPVEDADSWALVAARLGVKAAIALDSGCGPPVCVEWTEP